VYRGISVSYVQNIIQHPAVRLTPYAYEIIWDHSVGFDTKGQKMIILLELVKYFRKKGDKNEVIHQLFIDFKKAYDSARREVLYNILIEFVIPMKLVRLIKMYLNETHSIGREGKHVTC
jgi:hypothetical protein